MDGSGVEKRLARQNHFITKTPFDFAPFDELRVYDRAGEIEKTRKTTKGIKGRDVYEYMTYGHGKLRVA